VPRGGPDGGDGGHGGSVILVVDAGMTTLGDFKRKRHFKAADGGNGTGRKATGRSGGDTVVRVPPGTIVRSHPDGVFVGELLEADARLVVGRGGRGGRGNIHFATATHRAPKHAEKGTPGEEGWIELELKLIADIGLVGMPNAGKSTFLAAVSRARPKIADYPFTTLVPQLGVARAGGREFVIADLPGLIAGAHAGGGLGDRFLGHIERCTALLHLVDGAREDVAEAYRTIRRELGAYGHGLADKPELVGLNKCDLLTAGARQAGERALHAAGAARVVALSGATGEGVAAVLGALSQMVGTKAPAPAGEEPWRP